METNLIPNIFIDRDLSNESSLCVYVRDLPYDVNEVEIKFDTLPWEKILVLNSISNKRTFLYLKARKFYKVKAKYTQQGEEIRLSDASFSPFEKSPYEEDKDRDVLPQPSYLAESNLKIEEIPLPKVENEIIIKIFNNKVVGD